MSKLVKTVAFLSAVYGALAAGAACRRGNEAAYNASAPTSHGASGSWAENQLSEPYIITYTYVHGEPFLISHIQYKSGTVMQGLNRPSDERIYVLGNKVLAEKRVEYDGNSYLVAQVDSWGERGTVVIGKIMDVSTYKRYEERGRPVSVVGDFKESKGLEDAVRKAGFEDPIRSFK